VRERPGSGRYPPPPSLLVKLERLSVHHFWLLFVLGFQIASTIIPLYVTAADEPGTAESCLSPPLEETMWLVMAKGMEAGAFVMIRHVNTLIEYRF